MPTRSSSRRAERRASELALRRADILEAATAVFGSKGFYETQVAEIAAAAELSLKSVYTLFRGKDEIYATVLAETAERMHEIVQEKVQAIADPAERLLTLVDLAFDCFEENRDLFRIYVRTAHGLPPQFQQHMGEQTQSIVHSFTEWVVAMSESAKEAGYLAGVDARTFALTLVGAVTTSATDSLVRQTDQPLTRAAPDVRAILAPALRGASNRTP